MAESPVMDTDSPSHLHGLPQVNPMDTAMAERYSLCSKYHSARGGGEAGEVQEPCHGHGHGDDHIDHSNKACATCKNTKEEELKICSSCRSVWYCSVFCQKNHWPAHKALCKQAKAQNELSAKIQEEYEEWHLRSKDLLKSFCVSTLDESKVEGHVILLDMKRILQREGATHFKFEIFNAESVSNERLREINSELWAKAEEHRKNDCKSVGPVKHYIVMIRIEGDVIFRVGGIAFDFSQTDKVDEIKKLTGKDYLALINK